MNILLCCFQENFEKEIASQENAQFSVCQAEKTGPKIAALENQQDIKVRLRTSVVFLSKHFCRKPVTLCGNLFHVIIFMLHFVVIFYQSFDMFGWMIGRGI